MKRVGFLFEKAFTRESLYKAFVNASRHKHNKRSCYNFERRLSYNLDLLFESIQNGTYKPREYYTFTVFEPKPRKIYAPAFCDLVVQHAIYAAIYDIFNNSFIDQSFACRVGKGTHKAADYAQKAIQTSSRDSFYIKLDIRKFFYRINRKILRSQIEKKIKDRRFVDLMMMFSDHGEDIGIPIGNLLSQIYALIYLNSMDHFIKRSLKIKKYCRYVDDFILFGISKEKCLECLIKIKTFISNFGLELSKYTIASIKNGVNFVDYRTWSSKRFIRKHSIYKFRSAVINSRLNSAISILGHARYTHSLMHLINFLKERNYGLYSQLPKIYQR